MSVLVGVECRGEYVWRGLCVCAGGVRFELRGLSQLQREGLVDWFELRGGNEVVLYWRFLKV